MAARRGYFFLALTMLLALPGAARASLPALGLADLRDSAPLGYVLEVLEDPSRTLTFDDVYRGAYADRFRRADKFAPSYGITYSARWARFAVRNDGSRPIEALVVSANPQMQFVDFYASEDAERFAHLRDGQGVPVSQRAARDRRQVFPATIEPKKTLVVYMRFETSGVMALDLTLWDARAFLRADSASQLEFGVCLGLSLALIVYNILLYSAFQERSYLYYAFFVMSFGAYLGCLNGFASLYAWPEHPYWALRSTLVFGALAIASGVTFARRFLETAARAPRLDALFRVLTAGAAVILVATFVDIRATDFLAAADAGVSFVAVVVAAIVCWAQGFRPARHLLLRLSIFSASRCFLLGRLKE